MSYNLTKEELNLFENIEQTYYMQPILMTLSEYVGKYGNLETFNYLYEILTKSKLAIDDLLEARKTKGEIKDISQARKSIAGSAFSNCIIYLFLENKRQGNIKKNIFITNKVKNKIFVDLVTIKVDGETQKPYMDLIIYSLNPDQTLKKCLILSLKTSLRERVGQTYKWKLLMEIATSVNSVKDKYNIEYSAVEMPLVCFATVNFYNEINNPQHKGMFKFFDNSFIGKPNL